MPTISLCMIVRDEQKTLSHCLASVKNLVDEIVIVDTGSKDQTKVIAKNAGAKIFDFPWVDNFAAARNFSFEQATQDFILWLDADDVLTFADQERFKALKAALDPATDMVLMSYDTGFEDFRVTCTYWRERLLRRAGNYRWLEPVHEYIPLQGKLLYSDVHITHRPRVPKTPGRYCALYEKQTALSPRGHFYYGRELRDAGHPEQAIAELNKFIDLGNLWPQGQVQACLDIADCYRRLSAHYEERRTLFRSLEYATPRAENLCSIAWWYFERNNWADAIIWYEFATRVPRPNPDLGFITPASWGVGVYLQLAACYSNIGNFETARQRNEKASEFEPTNQSIIHNRAFLAAKLNPAPVVATPVEVSVVAAPTVLINEARETEQPVPLCPSSPSSPPATIGAGSKKRGRPSKRKPAPTGNG